MPAQCQSRTSACPGALPVGSFSSSPSVLFPRSVLPCCCGQHPIQCVLEAAGESRVDCRPHSFGALQALNGLIERVQQEVARVESSLPADLKRTLASNEEVQVLHKLVGTVREDIARIEVSVPKEIERSMSSMKRLESLHESVSALRQDPRPGCRMEVRGPPEPPPAGARAITAPAPGRCSPAGRRGRRPAPARRRTGRPPQRQRPAATMRRGAPLQELGFSSGQNGA